LIYKLVTGLADEASSKSGSTMAQKWRMNGRTRKKPRPPLDQGSLEQLALHYVGRYATTRAKLRNYLARKVRERGWEPDRQPPLAELAEKFSDLGYIDDASFAAARARSLSQRGYGARRVDQALHAAGIDEQDGREAREIAATRAWESALAFARKRRIGPFAETVEDRDKKRKLTAAMLRAGHGYDVVRRLVDAEPGIVPDPTE
jgi:regulatory protein